MASKDKSNWKNPLKIDCYKWDSMCEHKCTIAIEWNWFCRPSWCFLANYNPLISIKNDVGNMNI